MKSVVGKGIVIGSIMVLALLSAGAYALLNSSAPLEKKNILLNESFSVTGHTYENRTTWIDSSGEYVASFTVSEGTIKSTLMVGPIFSLWVEGRYEPDWVESDQADLGTGMSLGEGEEATMYFVFWNNDTFTKQVHLEASKIWEETNYVGLLGGAALFLSGTLTAIVLKYRYKPRNEEPSAV